MVTPLLSVFVITYKQEDYIEQTIRSILSQETSFDFELIVSNDCSPDNTSAVIQSIMSNHARGSVIRYFEHKVNLGMYGNFMFALNQCQGKYVAICEGDDYWTDSLKLQKQVDFLEANADYEVCFTNIRIVDAHDVVTKPILIKDNRKTDYERNDLPIWAPTLTRVFRNRDFNSLPSAPGLDTVMLLWQSQFGRIYFLNEITGAYRKHAGGIYSAQSEATRKAQILITDIVSLTMVDATLYSKYFGMIFKKLAALRYLDLELFRKNKMRVQQTFKKYKSNMNLFLIIKIKLCLWLVSLPLINNYKMINIILIKVLNRLFIY